MRFDPIGNVLFLCAVICLFLTLQWGGTKYDWSDGRIIALFVLFGVLLIAFVAMQVWQGENATSRLNIAEVVFNTDSGNSTVASRETTDH